MQLLPSLVGGLKAICATFPDAKAAWRQYRDQGNRAKNSCGYEACQEVVVPSGDFAPQTHGVFGGGSWHNVVGHVLDGGQVGGGVVRPHTAFVVAEAATGRSIGPRPAEPDRRQQIRTGHPYHEMSQCDCITLDRTSYRQESCKQPNQ